jgi:hypothetical protein
VAGADQFTQRISELQESVGHGHLTAHLLRDQVYAHYQEARLDLRHPQGGQAMYQESSLYDHRDDYLRGIAETVLVDITSGMIDAVEEFDGHAADRCPKELTLLSRSGHPSVTSEGTVVYDRAPEIPRLSKGDLKELGRLRSHGTAVRMHQGPSGAANPRPGTNRTPLIRAHGIGLWAGAQDGNPNTRRRRG